mmetsp:Transcript_113206/g.231709  ORF Transcript_113206/g.231709 Transcript_113206/m.231709 type:complete len:338 (-) Transcript_113206:288-1301(-)
MTTLSFCTMAMATGDIGTSRVVVGIFASPACRGCLRFQLACFVQPIAIASEGSIPDDRSFPGKTLWTIGFSHECMFPLSRTVSTSLPASSAVEARNSLAFFTSLLDRWSHLALEIVTWQSIPSYKLSTWIVRVLLIRRVVNPFTQARWSLARAFLDCHTSPRGNRCLISNCCATDCPRVSTSASPLTESVFLLVSRHHRPLEVPLRTAALSDEAPPSTTRIRLLLLFVVASPPSRSYAKHTAAASVITPRPDCRRAASHSSGIESPLGMLATTLRSFVCAASWASGMSVSLMKESSFSGVTGTVFLLEPKTPPSSAGKITRVVLLPSLLWAQTGWFE